MNGDPGFLELPGLRVTVDRVVYQPHVRLPGRPHCFAYYISIHNHAEVSVTIKGRKWVVTTQNGEIDVVEGDGVVGQFPTIAPGDKYSYDSFHVLRAGAAVAEGSYLGVDAEGRRVLARIPRFEMVVPPHA